MNTMSLIDCLYVSVFGMAVVFTVLIGLSILITIQSKLLNKKEAPAESKPPEATFSPELKLIDVDEKTAAMIIAIVCDESGFAPEELNFKYIKQI